jgi:hypothetical protein
MTIVRSRHLAALALAVVALATIAPAVLAVETAPVDGRWAPALSDQDRDITTNSGEPDTPHGSPQPPQQPNKYLVSSPRNEGSAADKGAFGSIVLGKYLWLYRGFLRYLLKT